MGKLAAGVILLHDNVRVLKSRVAQAAIRECKFWPLNHHTVQTWPQVIIIEILSHICAERDFGMMMSSMLLQRLSLKNKQTTFISKAYTS